jgi:phosphatidylserine/phosphatidylglycerophosphate/cardiolipin synthase-like enzyme
MFSQLLAASLLALSGASQAPGAPGSPFELVESAPLETTLDHADLRNAADVWLEMVGRAESSLVFSEFYVSNQAGSRLEQVVQAIERAASRGVKVRFLSEKKFVATYPETLERLGKTPGIEVRSYDVASLAGGILHAKYFLVDGRELFVGSQNFDWRSLEHIQELGVRVVQPQIARAYSDVFETDWALAGGAERTSRRKPPPEGYGFPVKIGEGPEAVALSAVFSPEGWLPEEALWDLPRLVELIDSAKGTVRLQLMTYRPTGRGKYFDTLENALRRAAARGVKVQMLLADWCKRSGTIEGLQSLQPLANVDVRMVTIPEWSGGFIPFARVIHAKYLIVDGGRGWIGTSNWESDYFHQSRNAGLLFEGATVGARLVQFFDDGWNSSYAYDVDPSASYEPPRIGE